MEKRRLFLACLCLVLLMVSVAANTAGVYGTGKKGPKIGIPGIQLTSDETAPTDSDLAAGRIYYDTTDGLVVYNGSSWGIVQTSAMTADSVYNAGTWNVTVDADDIGFTLNQINRSVKIYANGDGTTTKALLLDEKDASGTLTDALIVTASGSSSVVTDAVDVSATAIVNAINVGANVIIGTTAQIDFDEFDVAPATGSVTINDDSNAGAFTVEGTVLDINSLDFVGAGAITCAASSAITINPANGDAAGEDLIITANNIQLTNAGAVTLSPDGAVTTAIDITDGDYTNALSVGDNAILGTTGLINYDYFDLDATGLVTCVDLTTSDDIVCGDDLSVTGDLTISGTSTFATGTWLADAVTAKTGAGSLALNGDGAGGVVLGAVSTGGITLTRDTTCTSDLVINGGDLTMTSASASKPNLLFTNSVVGATGSVTTYDHTRGGVASVNADDIHTDAYNGYDSGPVADTFVTVLYEITDITAGGEDGNVTWSIVSAGSDLNFLELDGVDGVQINAGAVDVNTTVGTNDAADLVVIDAGNNDVAFTRNLAAGGTTDSVILTVTQSSATGDNGCASFVNAAAASATEATVTIQSSATGIDKSSLLVDHDGTAGATGESAVKITSDDVNTAALYITSPVTQAGTSAVYDETVAAFVATGVGGALSLYRNVTSATNSVLLVEDNHADSTGPLATFTYDGDATADDVAVTFQSTSAAYDEATVAITNAGLGRGLFITQSIATGATLEPALEIDSEMVAAAALVIRSPANATGTDADFDDYGVGISAEGIGGGLHVKRNVDDVTTSLVLIEDNHAITTSNANTLTVSSAADASASDSVVELKTTNAAHDQAVLQVTQAGSGATILVDGVTPAVVIGDAGEEDAQITFDGNAQDFYIGLRDTVDDLVIGVGAVLGTTQALAIDQNRVVTISVAINTPVETVAATNVITEYEGGKTFFLDHATEFVTTLPDAASSAGMRIKIIIANAPEDDDFTIVTEGSENVIVGGINELEVDTGDDGPYQAAGDLITFVRAVCVVGDWVELVCDGNKWYLTGQTQADGGIVLGST